MVFIEFKDLKEDMPCSPENIFGLNPNLDFIKKDNSRKLALRILLFSKENGKWVGVSWPFLALKILIDLFSSGGEENIRDHNLIVSNIALGIFDLLHNGFIQVECIEEGNETIYIYYPTKKLIMAILDQSQ